MDKAVHTDAKSSAPMSHLEEGAKSTLDPCNVFVKHLPSEWQDSDLTSSFGTYGSVISSKIMLDPTTRKSLGFGYVYSRFKGKRERCGDTGARLSPPEASRAVFCAAGRATRQFWIPQ